MPTVIPLRVRWLGAALVLVALAAPRASAGAPAEGEAAKAVAKTKLIPRDLLFGNPDRAGTKISPDGKYLSFLAPVKGVLNVWVGPTDRPDAAKPVTKDTKRGIRTYFWTYTNKHILYAQDAEGDENWHIYRVDLTSGDIKNLTPLKKVAARIQGVSYRFPGEILIALNDRDARYHDVYRLNLESGKRALVQQNEGFLGSSPTTITRSGSRRSSRPTAATRSSSRTARAGGRSSSRSRWRTRSRPTSSPSPRPARRPT